MAVNPLVLAFGAGLWCLRRAALPVTLGGSCGVTKRSRAQTQGVEVMMAEPPAIVDWAISEGLVAYEAALAAMEARVGGIAEGRARELVWLLEHPPIYTAGTSAKSGDLLQPDRFPVHTTGRGGQYTYHGPGQRVIYVMLDVRRWAGSESGGGDVRRFVGALEGWLIETLAAFNVTGETRPDRVGVWVRRPDVAPGREDKIAAIGIRLKRWISLHGMSLNVEPDLEHFSGIVPCGVAQHGVTSLVDLGLPVTMADADVALHASFEARFGKTQRVSAPTAAAAIDAGPSHHAT